MEKLFLRTVSAALLALSFAVSPVMAQYSTGQTVFMKYCGEWREAKFLGQDSSGAKIEFRNALNLKFDGSGIRYAQMNELTGTKPLGYNAKGYGNTEAGGEAMPAGDVGGAVQPATGSSGPAPGAEGLGQYIHHPQPANPNTVDQVKGTPRLGRYIMRAFSSSYSYAPANTVGWFDLNQGTYKTSYGTGGNWQPGGDGIIWLSGPYKSENYLGIVRSERGGLTTRVTLLKNERGYDRMVGFNSADK